MKYALVIGGANDGEMVRKREARICLASPVEPPTPIFTFDEASTTEPAMRVEHYRHIPFMADNKAFDFYIREGMSASEALEALINSYQCRHQAVECERCGHKYQPANSLT